MKDGGLSFEELSKIFADVGKKFSDMGAAPMDAARLAPFSTTCAAPVQLTEPMRLNAEKTVAVSNEVFWNEDMSACPRGVKVQLLGQGGVAAYGTFDGKDPFWVKWQSVPRNRRKE